MRKEKQKRAPSRDVASLTRKITISDIRNKVKTAAVDCHFGKKGSVSVTCAATVGRVCNKFSGFPSGFN